MTRRHEESEHSWPVHMQSILENFVHVLQLQVLERIHLCNGLYDVKADNTPVIAVTGTTYSI